MLHSVELFHIQTLEFLKRIKKFGGLYKFIILLLNHVLSAKSSSHNTNGTKSIV